MHVLHDDKTAGHLGRDKTVGRISKMYWWPSLRRDVTQYVAPYYICQRRKLQSIPQHTGVHPIPPPRTPFEVVGIDHLGPFPRSRGDNRFVLVAVVNEKA